MSRHKIPVPTALYRLYDANDELLYVGISTRPNYRFIRHRKTQSWWPDVDHFDIAWHPSFDAAQEAESKAIGVELPRHNIRYHPVNGPACVARQLETYARNRALKVAEQPERESA